ncbi:MAG: NAD(P)-dependent glycerol-3-phosphate dehydrogenase [Rhodobacteraceae bacterium]|jgi:glycerol-3-phosphate dehydrogenase (NAD(P)+)|nr:NAD(P)-dependent glycerol-3-phosphate dehydrogenase [Paracoccaceae bacterium]
MSGVAVLGAGAFGTALAVALAARGPVALWARDAAALVARRQSPRLPGVALPPEVAPTGALDRALAGVDTVLLAVPMQALGGFLAGSGAALDGRSLVGCMKGLDLTTGAGPSAMIAAACPRATVAVLTGPSFAADIARGLPTALTLACADAAAGERLQHALSTPALRLYRTADVAGAEIGGALKNVVAIAAGLATGAGLGESARAALITRGHAEISRLALALGARAETLAGLAGLGDLILTCTSPRSRNFAHGLALAEGRPTDHRMTVEGVATAGALVPLAARLGVEMPLAATVAEVCAGRLDVAAAAARLLARPLRAE